MTKPLALRLLAPTFAVCTLPSDAALPDIEADFFSIPRTADELSLVVPETDILFVRQDDLDRAQSTLAAAGHPTVP